MFWDFSITPAVSASPEATPTPPLEPETKEAEDIAHPSRDEILDSSRGGQEGESRDEGKANCDHERNQGDFSVFSTLTELLFSPFSDGYCKTPFCSDYDYMPPSCPSGRLYTTPDEVRVRPQQDHSGSDDYGDICKSDSAASSTGGHPARRRRPLAFAVGHGDGWKDAEGRRVVITPRRNHPLPHSPPRYSSPHRQNHYSKASTCTCLNPASTNSLAEKINESPHQTKSVVCKFCLEAPSSRSSDSQPLPPIL